MIKIIDLNFKGIDNAIAAFLLETSIGPILIETGPYSSFEALKAGLKGHGYTIEDIKHVLITHIHLDHAGAVWAMAKAGATIYLHPFGERHMMNPEKLWKSARLIYGNEMEKLWGEMQEIEPDKLRTVGHAEELIFGDTKVIAWHTPGHARHHIAWQIGDTLFAGDVAGVRIGNNPIVPPCPPPDIDLEAWMESLDLIQALNIKQIFLTHFGETTSIDEHIAELRAVLMSWANWIKPYFDSGETPSEIIPKFQRFTAAQLRDKGVSEHGIVQYETANPSWMSVSGLLRYWKKRLEKEEAT